MGYFTLSGHRQIGNNIKMDFLANFGFAENSANNFFCCCCRSDCGILNIKSFHANRNCVVFNQLYCFYSEMKGLFFSSSVNCQAAGGCCLLSF